MVGVVPVLLLLPVAAAHTARVVHLMAVATGGVLVSLQMLLQLVLVEAIGGGMAVRLVLAAALQVLGQQGHARKGLGAGGAGVLLDI